MRKLLSLFLVFVLALGIVCAHAEEKTNEYEFVTGDWLIAYGDGELELYLYIYENGTFEEMFKEDVPLADDGSNTIPGTWTFDGTTLVLTANGVDLPLLWNAEAHEFKGEADGVAVTVKMPIEAEAAGSPDFAAMMMSIPGAEQLDWGAFVEAYSAKVANGEAITLEDCLPAGGWQLYSVLMTMDENGQIPDPETLPYTIETVVKGNEMVTTFTYKEQVDEAGAQAIVAAVAAQFESPESLATLKSSMDQMASGGIDAGKVVMELKHVNADGSVIYDKSYTYADLTAALEPAA